MGAAIYGCVNGDQFISTDSTAPARGTDYGMRLAAHDARVAAVGALAKLCEASNKIPVAWLGMACSCS